MAKKRKQQEESETGNAPVSMYMPTELLTQIDSLAKEECRSRSQMMQYLIREALSEREAVTAK